MAINGSVTYGGTVYLGNYENVKLEFTRSYTALSVDEARMCEASILLDLRMQFDKEKARLTEQKVSQ